jgi:Zn-dependent protease with chaperone function
MGRLEDWYNFRTNAFFLTLVGLWLGLTGLLGLVLVNGWRMEIFRETTDKCQNSLFTHSWHIALLLLTTGLVLLSAIKITSAAISDLRASAKIIAQLAQTQKTPPSDLQQLAKKLTLPPIVFFTAKQPLAFSFGLIKPKIAISDSLYKISSNQELQAILLHEKYHVDKKHTFKALIAKAIANGFFFLPVAKVLWEGFIKANELSADARVISELGSSLALTSALLTVLRSKTEPSVASFLNLNELRYQQLKKPTEKVKIGFWQTRPAIISAATMAFILASLSSLCF